MFSEDEIRALWAELAADSCVAAKVILARLLLGQRTAETVRQAKADLDRGWWNLPAVITKNGKPHRIPLGPLYVQHVLAPLGRLNSGSRWIFSSSYLSQEDRHLGEQAVVNRMSQLTAKLGIDGTARDLRRTVGSHMTRLGVAQQIVSRLFNHTIPGVTAGHYDLYTYDVEKVQAIEVWHAELRRIVSAESGLAVVHPFRAS